jgi:serine/threonine-protein kinase RIM15
MWVVRPFVEPTEITIDLAPVLVESLGVGAGMLARYLTSLAEQGAVDTENHPPPASVLCRICERQIQPWWFEKHSELCMLEHKAESDVQLCQENLGMHRQAIVKVLDAMERRTTREATPGTHTPIEYRGLPIGPSSTPSSGAASPATPPKSRDHSASGSIRSRNGPYRRPLVRIVELLLDLCDTALEISTPAIKDGISSMEASADLGSIRTQSPESEARISQVMQWQSPTTNTLEEEKGLALLCQDTEAAARAKVEAVYRHRNTIEYSERIRLEFSILVQDCIDEALRKASEGHIEHDMDEEYSSASEDGDESIFEESFCSMQRSNSTLTEPTDGREPSRRHSSPAPSGTTSPMECSTPKSQHSLHRTSSSRRARYSHRSSIQFDNEGADSDTSAKSSLAAAFGHAATESPVSDHDLTARFSSRDHKRRSAFQPTSSSHSPKRQISPAGRAPSSSSPLRIAKPRNSMYESMPTPITSPLLSTGDFSPALEHNFHHRRQSSATLSDQVKAGIPSSPHLSGVNPSQQNRAVPPSIKDFEIIKPISKGAFGSVYLSKKKSTGDYFAIKVLKKADMIAKNQVTNVRAERAIMMVQGESDFVAKLFWTFASKDYLYLVMEYLNGGDCGALIKVLQGLPEEWAKKYVAEVVLGLEHLHSKGIVHRDLKPDNLLIDQKGHLKLTDFGLSRMGLIGRQKRAQTQSLDSTPDLLKQGPFVRSNSMASSRSTSFDYPGAQSPSVTPSIIPENNAQLITPSYFSLNRENTLSRESSLRRASNPRSDSGSAEQLHQMLQNFNLNDPANFSAIASRRTPTGDDDARSETSNSSDFSALGLQHVTSHTSQSQVLQPAPPQQQPQIMPPQLALFNPEDNNNRKFVGTPDYLAPETINGTGQDETSDWWSLGCILFEFIYGYPPFNAETPEEVFENILARKIDWPDEEDDEASPEARNLMESLMCSDQTQRLGANGAEEVKKHPFFADINWETLLEEEPSFVPESQDPENTEYFDSRGAVLQSFTDEFDDQSTPCSTPGADLPERPHDAVSRVRKDISTSKRGLIPLSIPPHIRESSSRNRRLSEPVQQDDFGSFTFKNLPVLEKANKDVIQKLRTEALKNTPALTTSNPASPLESSPISIKPLSRALSTSSGKSGSKRPVSPSGLQNASSPARSSQPSSPLLLSFTAGTTDKRKASTASASSSLSQQSSSSLQPGPFMDVPRLPTAGISPSGLAASSPIKMQQSKTFIAPSMPTSMSISPTISSHERTSMHPPPYNPHMQRPSTSGSSSGHPRVRSLTIGSQDGEPAFIETFRHQQKRRSQVFDMSPSSSDNEEVRSSALLRVQRRRQSARRMSNISFDCPAYRPLDVLVCEDHPISRMVMERLLEKLKCRSIMVENGAEAMRYAMGEVKCEFCG